MFIDVGLWSSFLSFQINFLYEKNPIWAN
jgi:hypothetical protein